MSAPIIATCVDPGSEQSAIVNVRVSRGHVLSPPWGIEPVAYRLLPNEDVVSRLATRFNDIVLIESIISIFGSEGSTDQLETVRWEGVFRHICKASNRPCLMIARASARAAVTLTAKANDSAVRRGLINLYGGEAAAFGKRCKCGGKRKSLCPTCQGTGWQAPPGVFRGWTGTHGFAALALAFAAFAPGGSGYQMRTGGAP